MDTGSSSFWAAEGTAAHALCELLARQAFGLADTTEDVKDWEAWNREYDQESMWEGARRYVAFLEEHRLEHLMLEQRLETGVQSCFGTSDAVMIGDGTIHIVDFKYGSGYAVDAEDNSQLRLYALGAIEQYSVVYDFERVLMSIVQPRAHNIVTVETTVQELLDWREQVVRPRAEEALGPDAPFGPSEQACRWCPVSGNCRPQMEHLFGEWSEDAVPDNLSEDEMAGMLARVPAIKHWLSAFEEAALSRVYSEGKHIPGWKVVLSGGQRKVVDPQGLTAKLLAEGYDPEDFATVKLEGIGKLERLLKNRFAEVAGDYVQKSEGRPSLVKENDRRPSVHPETEARKEFS